jgi:uncharacterized protein YecE (DUF72 family)
MYLADVYQCNENFTKSQVNTHNFFTKPQDPLQRAIFILLQLPDILAQHSTKWDDREKFGRGSPS